MLMKKNFKFKWLENTKKNRKGKMKRENCERHDEREIKTEFLVEIQATERGVSS